MYKVFRLGHFSAGYLEPPLPLGEDLSTGGGTWKHSLKLRQIPTQTNTS